MKRFLAGLMISALLLPMASTAFVNAAETVVYPGPGANSDGGVLVKDAEVFINDARQTLELKPIVKSAITYLPIREISEKLGLHIEYDGKTHTAYVLESDKTTNLPKAEKGDQLNVFVFNKAVKFSNIIIENGRAYVPASEFAKALGKIHYQNLLSNSTYLFDNAVALADGEYVTVGLASRGWVPQVNLTVKDGKIVSATYEEYNAEGVAKSTDTEGYLANWYSRYPEANLAKAIETFTNELIQKQDPHKVDVTTGATGAYNNFVALTSKAIGKAKATTINAENLKDYKDGKYVVIGIADSKGDVPVLKMEVKDGKVVDVFYDEVRKDGVTWKRTNEQYLTNWKSRYTETNPNFDPVAIIAEREAQFLKTQDANLVDAATGATSWGYSFKMLAAGALDHAARTEMVVDADTTIYIFVGKPTAKSPYFVQLLALGKNQKMTFIDYNEYQTATPLPKQHNPAYLTRWAERTPDVLQGRNQLDIQDQMLEHFMAKGVEGIDAITGATNWRKGIVELAPKALEYIKNN